MAPPLVGLAARRVLSRAARASARRAIEIRQRRGGEIEEIALELGGVSVAVEPPARFDSLGDLPL